MESFWNCPYKGNLLLNKMCFNVHIGRKKPFSPENTCGAYLYLLYFFGIWMLWKKIITYDPWACVVSTHSWSWKKEAQLWGFEWLLYLCTLSACLDLADFPQTSQEWLTPVIWFASICLITCDFGPSLPQMLQALLWSILPVVLIIDLIFSSSKFANSRFVSYSCFAAILR